MSNSTKHWVVHWFLIDRDDIAFTNIEQFHLKVFEKYKSFIMTNFDKITISFAKTDKTNPILINYIEHSIELMFLGKNIEFQIRNNNQRVGEFETFRDNVLDKIDSSEKILYTHIKGVYRVTTYPELLKRELLWIWKMYQVVFNNQSMNSLDDFIMSGPDFSIYDSAFNVIKTGKWNPVKHIFKTYLSPLKIELEKDKDNQLLKKYIDVIPNMKERLPWAYLGTFYWINTEKLKSYIEEIGFSKNDILSIADEFQKYDRPKNMNNATSKLNGCIVKFSFANNVSEYFLPSIVDAKKCSFFKIKQ